LLNAIAHKDYSGGVPIQISIYNDKLMIWNEGQLPENWTVKNLLEKHASRPYNPDIANSLFRSGYIESWGRGTIKIINECKKAGIPEPVFTYDSSDISVEFRKDIYNEKGLQPFELNERQFDALLFFKPKGEILSSEYVKKYAVTDRTARYDLSELVQKNLLIKQGDKKSTKYVFPINFR
jgi:ATP-dependent DNA helicase RecG